MVRNLTYQDYSLETPPPYTAVGLAENVISETVYDGRGNAIAQIAWARMGNDVIGRITRTYYDDLNRAEYVVQNLTGWGINEPQPPPEYLRTPNQNIITRTFYGMDGSVQQTTDNAGRVTHYCYDWMNRVIRTVQNPTVADPCFEYAPSGAADEDIIRQTAYDANGNAIAAIDPLGVTTRTYYDALNRPYLVLRNLTYQHYSINTPPPESAFGNTENVATGTRYDEAGNAIASIEWRVVEGAAVVSHTTRTYYDALNRPYLVARNLTGQDYRAPIPPPENSFGNDENVTTGTIYDDQGRAIASVEWLEVDGLVISHTTRTYYDALGRTIAVVRNLVGDVYAESWPSYDPNYPDQNVRSEYAYNGDGRQVAVIEIMDEANRLVTRTYYDVLGRAETNVRNLDYINHPISNPAPPAYDPQYPDVNLRRDTFYDGSGQAVGQRDWLAVDGAAVGRLTRTYYDGLGRSYLVVSNLANWDVLNPHPPACSRDSAGPQQPENICQETIYDAAGNAIAAIDPLGRITRSYYDQANRPAAVVRNLEPGWDVYAGIWPAYSATNPDQNVRSQMYYDRAGRNTDRLVVMEENTPGGLVATHFEYRCNGKSRGEG